MKLFKGKRYYVFDIGLISLIIWSSILFGLVAGAYLSDFTLRYVWLFLIVAALLAIKPTVTYFKDFDVKKSLFSPSLKVEELAILHNEDIPVILLKLWAGIDKLKEILSKDGYIVTRNSGSRSSYTFGIERTWGRIWVSLDYYYWVDYKTPYFLKINDYWIKEPDRFSDLEIGLKKIVFIHDKAREYFYPISITEADPAVSAAMVVKEKIKHLDEMFEQLLK